MGHPGPHGGHPRDDWRLNVPKIRSFTGGPGSDIKSHLSKVRKYVRIRATRDANDQIDFLLTTLEG